MPDKKPSSVPSSAALVCLTVIICFVIACVTGLTWAGRDISQVMYLITIVAAPTIASIVNLVSTNKIKDKQHEVSDKIDSLVERSEDAS